jgi:hypothetical protein
MERLHYPDYKGTQSDIPIVGNGPSEVPFPGMRWFEEELVIGHLSEYADSLQKLHAAAENSDAGRYPTDFSQGLEMSFEHGEVQRVARRLLELESHVAARRGDSEAAARSIHTMLSLSESYRLEPAAVTQLVRVGSHYGTLAALEDMLRRITFSDDDLALLQADLERIDFQDGTSRLIIGERVVAIGLFQDPSLATDPEDFRFYLECMKRLRAAADKSWPLLIDEIADLAKSVESQGDAHPDTASLLPGIIAAVKVMASVEAKNRAGTVALAAERFRRMNGRSPETLEELTPTLLARIPTDPVNDAVLRFFIQGNQVTVYSIGIDRVDNQGRDSEGKDDGDETFTITLRGNK